MALLRGILVSICFLLSGASPTVVAAEVPRDAPQGSAGSTTYGVNEPNSWRRTVTAPTPGQVGDMLQGLHAEAHRWAIPWNEVERESPIGVVHSYDFSQYDAMYDADLARGIEPLITVINAPTWAYSTGVPKDIRRGIPPAPEHLEDWADFCAEVARRYPEAIGIEIWNEPNLTAFWGHGLTNLMPNPHYYTELLSNAHEAIKKINPSMTVIGGALSNAPRSLPTGQISGASFLATILGSGAARYMDAVSFHAYPFGSLVDLDHSLFEQSLDQIRHVKDATGVQLPIWITEIGVTTSPGTVLTATEHQQGSILSDFFRWVQTQADIEAFFIHTLTERMPGKGYAMMNGDANTGFTPKPVYTALARTARGAVPDPATPSPAIAAPSSPELETPSGLPLRFRLRRLPNRNITRHHTVTVRIRCNQGCSVVTRGTARITYKGRTKQSRLRPGRTNFRAGQPGKVVLTLPGAARRKLSRGASAKIRVLASVRAVGGSRTSDLIAFRLRR